MFQPAVRASLLFAALVACGAAAAADATMVQASAQPAASAAVAAQPQGARVKEGAKEHAKAQADDEDEDDAKVVPAELKTIDGIVDTLYETLSGPAGAPRNWNRLRSLFTPEGRMVVHGPNKAGEMTTRVLTLSDYISRVKPIFEKSGFYESELARSTDTFGQIAHVLSTYQSHYAKDDAKPFQRGINSIQLVNDGERWWIQSLLWQAETDKTPLPARYLKGR